MAEFTPITIESQEQLDGMFKDRLNRQNEKHSKEISELKAQLNDYEALKEKTSGFESQIAELTNKLNEADEKTKGYDSQIAERDAKIKAYEEQAIKTKVASEMNLTLDAVEFLKGENEDEIRASAEKLSKITPKRVAPLAGTSSEVTDTRTQAFKLMLNS